MIELLVMALAMLAYVILDGFDLGVGVLLLKTPEVVERDSMIASIGPAADNDWLAQIRNQPRRFPAVGSPAIFIAQPDHLRPTTRKFTVKTEYRRDLMRATLTALRLASPMLWSNCSAPTLNCGDQFQASRLARQLEQ